MDEMRNDKRIQEIIGGIPLMAGPYLNLIDIWRLY
jgi:hypothetical protein